MIKLLQSDYGLIVDQAVFCVGNFSSEAPFRNLLVEQNVIQQLICIAEKQRFQNQNSYKTAVWSLCNIVRAPPCLIDTKNNNLTDFFSDVIKEFDNGEILIDSLQALSEISRENYQIDSIFKRNAIPKLVQLLKQPNKDIYNPTFKIITNLLNGNNDQIEILLQQNIVEILEALLENKEKSIICQVFQCIKNITAGTTSQVNQILRNNSLMSKLLHLINQQNLDYNLGINLIFSNALINGSLEDVDYAIDLGLLLGIKKLLTQTLIEEQLIITLKGLEELQRKIYLSNISMSHKLIKDQALDDIIEQLQYHMNSNVQSQAQKILINSKNLRNKFC